MSTESTEGHEGVVDDDPREHATAPAEGAVGNAAAGPDVREHADEPAEGADDAG